MRGKHVLLLKLQIEPKTNVPLPCKLSYCHAKLTYSVKVLKYGGIMIVAGSVYQELSSSNVASAAVNMATLLCSDERGETQHNVTDSRV